MFIYTYTYGAWFNPSHHQQHHIMASSKKHWPSMFKSKPCCNANQNNPQWQHHQHDLNSPSLLSSCYPRTASHTSERSPEPKPRWNPRPEQIRILEAIFNSGTVNPPRDEIKKIRAQLQEYGQVGDANVFYWFQNRKSRSKHKLRHLHNSKQQPHHHNSTVTSAAATAITAPSSSSSSDKYSPTSTDMTFPFGSATIIDMSNSPTSSVNQPYFQTPNEFLPEPYFFPVQQTSGAASASAFTQGFCFPELANWIHVPTDQTAGDCSNLLLMSELMMNHSLQKKVEVENQNLQQLMSYTAASAPTASIHSVPPPTVPVPSSIGQILGDGSGDSAAAFGPEKSTVFINDVAFEVAFGPFNVREAFGDDAVLVNSSGLPLVTNQWGLTIDPLQHGEFYYLIRTSIPITPESQI